MINIGIIFGGVSTEHDISIISFYQVLENINMKYNIYPIYISKDNNVYLASHMRLDDFKNSDYKLLTPLSFIKGGFMVKKRVTLLDSVIILTHGINGEDGKVASLLEFYDIKYVGSNPYSSVICMDKDYTYRILKDYPDIKMVPHSFSFDHLEFDEGILKPAHLGSSIGINLCNKKNFKDAYDKTSLFDRKVVIEKRLKSYKEFNIAVYKENSIKTSEVFEVSFKGDIFSFDEKYYNDEKKHIKANHDLISDEIKRIAIKVYSILELDGIVRIDFLVDKDNIYLNEINTIPGGLSYYMFDNFKDTLDEAIKYSMIKTNGIKNILDENILNIRGIKK